MVKNLEGIFRDVFRGTLSAFAFAVYIVCEVTGWFSLVKCGVKNVRK